MTSGHLYCVNREAQRPSTIQVALSMTVTIWRMEHSINASSRGCSMSSALMNASHSRPSSWTSELVFALSTQRSGIPEFSDYNRGEIQLVETRLRRALSRHPLSVLVLTLNLTETRGLIQNHFITNCRNVLALLSLRLLKSIYTSQSSIRAPHKSVHYSTDNACPP